MTFKYIHTADLHLDSPFISLGKVDHELANVLRDASLDALDNIVELAITEQVNFVLFAGDIYDGARRGVRAQFRFLKGLRKLDEHGIRALVIHGNHDPISEGWSAISEFPANTHFFSANHPETLDFDFGDDHVTVTGMSFPTRHVTESLSRRFKVPAARGFHIAMLHTALDDSERGANYSPTWSTQLKASGFDYWALGHIHTRTEPGEHPFIVYPGNPIGRGFGANERGQKGVYLVTVKDGQADVDFRVTGNAVFLELTVDASDFANISDLQDQVVNRLAQVALESIVEYVACRVVIDGRTSLYDALKRPDLNDDFLEALADITLRRDVQIFWTSLLDQTLPLLDLTTVADDSFLGVMVRQSNEGKTDIQKALAQVKEDFSGLDAQTLEEIKRRALERAAHLINQ